MLPREGCPEPGSPGEGPAPIPATSTRLSSGSQRLGTLARRRWNVSHSPGARNLAHPAASPSRPAGRGGGSVIPGDSHTVTGVSPPQTYDSLVAAKTTEHRVGVRLIWGAQPAGPQLLTSSLQHQAGTTTALPDSASGLGAGQHPVPALPFPLLPSFIPETPSGQAAPKLRLLLITRHEGPATRRAFGLTGGEAVPAPAYRGPRRGPRSPRSSPWFDTCDTGTPSPPEHPPDHTPEHHCGNAATRVTEPSFQHWQKNPTGAPEGPPPRIPSGSSQAAAKGLSQAPRDLPVHSPSTAAGREGGFPPSAPAGSNSRS